MSCFCFLSPAAANLSLQADALDRAIRTYFPNQTNASAALVAYTEFVRNGDGVSIAAKDLWAVCSAGGLDIKKPEPKKTCQSFVNHLVKNAIIKYFEVCGSDKGKSGGTEVCVDAFKNTRLNLSPATAMAKEYVAIKYNDNSLICSSKMRTASVSLVDNDDFIKCTSTDTNTYYEFEFGTAEAWRDSVIQNNVRYGVCDIIYGIPSGSRTDSCEANEAMCKKVNKSVKRFGYSAYMKNDRCYINFETVKSATDLKNDFRSQGVENFYFCSNAIQVKNNQSLHDAIKEYIAGKTGADINLIECDAGFKSYTGSGCKTGWSNYRDDIITCSYNGKVVDLVFDDVNEINTTRATGGMEGMQCMLSGGVFDSRNCVALGEQQCNALKEKMAAVCNDNCASEIRWNAQDGLCELPNATTATRRTEIAQYAAKAGVAIAMVAATVVTAGAAGGVFAVVATAGSVAMVTGTAIELGADAQMKWGLFEPFIREKANPCLVANDSACAERVVREDLQKYMSYNKEFNPQQQSALDDVFHRLIDLIPEDSSFWEDFYGDPENFKCDANGENCQLLEKTQALQKWRRAGQITTAIGSLLNIIGNVGGMVRSIETINAKVVGNMHGPAMLKHLHNGHVGSLVSNKTILKFTGTARNADLVRNMGWTVGKEVVLRSGPKGLVAWLKPNGMALVVFGSALARMGDTDSTPFVISRPNKGGESSDTPEETEGGGSSGGGSTGGGSTGGGTGSTIPGGEDDDTGDGDNPGGGDETVPHDGGTGPVVSNTVDDNIMYKTIKGKKLIAPENNKNKGLVAALVATGVVATGALIGGIVVSTSKDKSGNDNNVANKAIETDTDLQLITNNIRSGFGYVNNNQISLVPLPTSVGSSAPIVVIDGYAVVVVSYAGYRLPFYMNGTTWAPVLGIGETGHWFNVYPAVNEIKKMDTIAGVLNEKLPPFSVAKYTNNMGGVSFPVADQKAFAIINAEFPNGVVQSVNMTPADQQLYSNNYYLMKSKIQ